MNTDKILPEKSNTLEEFLKTNANENLIENITKERYLYPKSDKVFDDVSNFFFLNKESHENMSLISSKFLMSSFSLEYLKLLNKLINSKFDIPQLTLGDFEDSEKIDGIVEKIAKSQNEPLMNWLKEECLAELSDAVDNFVIDDINKLNKLGHIIKLTTNELQDKKEYPDIELYDTFYRFIERLNNFELCRKKSDMTLKCRIIKKSKEGDSIVNYELKFKDENVPAVTRIMREFDY